MVGWHHRLNGHESEQAPGAGDGQGGLACCSPWGSKESDTSECLNWTEPIYTPALQADLLPSEPAGKPHTVKWFSDVCPESLSCGHQKLTQHHKSSICRYSTFLKSKMKKVFSVLVDSDKCENCQVYCYIPSLCTHVCMLSWVRLFCKPMYHTLPDSSVYGVLQARILEWVATPSSRGSSPPRPWTPVSCITREPLYLSCHIFSFALFFFFWPEKLNSFRIHSREAFI